MLGPEIDRNDLGLTLASARSILTDGETDDDNGPFVREILSDGASSPPSVVFILPSEMGKRDSSCWGVRIVCRGVNDKSDFSDEIIKALNTVWKQSTWNKNNNMRGRESGKYQ